MNRGSDKQLAANQYYIKKTHYHEKKTNQLYIADIIVGHISYQLCAAAYSPATCTAKTTGSTEIILPTNLRSWKNFAS